MIIDGVTLPDISAEVLAQYPYAVILEIYTTDSTGAEGTYYMLLAAGSEFFGGAGSVLGLDFEELCGSMSAGIMSTAAETSSSWDEDYEELAARNCMFPLGKISEVNTVTLVWSNHIVYRIVAIDTDTGAYTVDGIFFPEEEEPEEPEEVRPTRYSIAASILDDIVHAIQLQRKNDKKLKPEEIAGVIRKMLVLPSGEAESTLTGLRFTTAAVGVLPTVYKGTATSTLTGLAFETSAVGVLTE